MNRFVEGTFDDTELQTQVFGSARSTAPARQPHAVPMPHTPTRRAPGRQLYGEVRLAPRARGNLLDLGHWRPQGAERRS